MTDSDRDNPSDRLSRREMLDSAALLRRCGELMDRFFEHAITREETTELLNIFDRHPALERRAVRWLAMQCDLALLSGLTRRDTTFLFDSERIVSMPIPDTLLQWEGRHEIDFSELVRLEAESKALPFSPSSSVAEPTPRYASARLRNMLEKSIRWTVLGSVGFLILGILVITASRIGSSRSGATEPMTVARLTGFDHVVWGDCVAPIQPDDPMEDRLYRIHSGRVSFRLNGGAEMVVEGPSEFRLGRDNDLILNHGNLSADVPPQARHMLVETSGMKIIVLGTAFWIDASEEGSEVHLVRGRLHLAGTAFGKTQLRSGQAFSLRKDGKSRSFDAVASGFRAAREVIAKTEETFRDWERAADAAVARFGMPATTAGGLKIDPVDADPSLLIRFDFDRAGRSVANLAPGGRDAIPAGKINGCAVVKGRHAHGRAVSFRRRTDRIDLEVPGKHRSLTLCAWVKTGRAIETRLPVFMSAGMPPGALQWMIGHNGIVQLNVAKTKHAEAMITRTAPIFTWNRINRWVHLATVVDADAREIAFYVDGAPFETREIASPPEIQVGPAMLGHWDIGRDKNRESKELSLDEFLLFDRALDAREIRSLVEDR